MNVTLMLPIFLRPDEEGAQQAYTVKNAAAVATVEEEPASGEHKWLKACGPLRLLEKRFSRLANVKTAIIDSGDLPVNW